MSQSDKCFLVRSAGQILGPFSKEEVITLIKESRISIFDEVAEPFSIWFHLQDHEDFRKTVYSMDTKTRLTNFLTKISQKMGTYSQTGDKTAPDDKNITSSQKISSLDFKAKQSAKEVSFEVLNQAQTKSSPFAKYMSQRDSEEIVRKKIGRMVRLSWYAIVFLALSVGSYVFYNTVIVSLQERKSIIENLESRGFSFYKAGNYKEALPYFEAADIKDILPVKDKIRLASLFLQEGRIQKAELIVQGLSENSELNTGEGLLLNGLLSLAQDNFSKAEEFFNSSLKNEETRSLINLSLLKWTVGNYRESLAYLDRLTKSGYERDIVFYLRALNLLSQNYLPSLSSYIHQDISFSDSSSRLVVEYHQEFYLLQAYLYMKEGKLEELNQTVIKLLNQDPFFYRDYKYDSFVFFNALDWKALYPYCKSIFDFDSKSSLFNALYGFCYLKMGDFKKGSGYIEQAKNSELGNPLFMALYAYLLQFQGLGVQLEQVFSLIDYSQLNSSQPLPLILKAYFFETNKDWARALSVWKDLLSIQEDHISGLAGVARVHYKMGNSLQGDLYKKKALEKYPYHIRLLSYPSR